jgi:NitT/TauT family transport system substrate-binding protein
MAAVIADAPRIARAATRAPAIATLRVATPPVDLGAQVDYAQELGLFKVAGLDVEITAVSNGSAIASAVLAGSYDIGQGNIVSLAAAHRKGIPFVIVAPAGYYDSHAPTTILAVAANSTLRNAADLAGKTIAISGIRSINEVTTDAWIDHNGGDSKAVKYVEMPFSAMVPALTAGRVDAAVLVNPAAGVALSQNLARMLGASFDATGSRFLIAAYFSTADFAKQHPEVVARFTSAIAQAGRWANAHRKESAAMLSRWAKIDVAPAMPRVVYADRLSAAETQPLIDVAAKYGVLDASFPARELFAPGTGES